MFRYMPPSVDKCPHDHFRALLYLELLHLSAVLFICVSLLVFSQIESTLASCPDDNALWNAGRLKTILDLYGHVTCGELF